MIQRTIAKKAASLGRKRIWPGGCIPPYFRPDAVKKMIERKLTPAGASFKFDAVNLSQKARGVWTFKGTGTRRPFVGPHHSPLGGQRLEVKGVFNAFKQEITGYSEKVLALLRSFPKP